MARTIEKDLKLDGVPFDRLTDEYKLYAIDARLAEVERAISFTAEQIRKADFVGRFDYSADWRGYLSDYRAEAEKLRDMRTAYV
jgi:hypothetical protein